MNDELLLVLRGALESLKKGPKDLGRLMDFYADTNDIDLKSPVLNTVKHIEGADPNDPILNCLALKIHEWDHHPASQNNWTKETTAHSQTRRDLILKALGVSGQSAKIVNEKVPLFTRIERPVVIAENHESWYERSAINFFYWNDYVDQLMAPKGGWKENAVSKLNGSTDDIVSRLSDPAREEIYQVKGLVVGYVQSGKTAHFSGVIAKAVDAGYRLVIVLAGTLNILRKQTQRRIDKELVGKELLAGLDYESDAEWDQFVIHGGLPSQKGSVDIERLTGLEDDYTPLKQHIANLEFQREDRTKRFNDAANLKRAPARLIVIKKRPGNIRALADDLEKIRKRGYDLDQIPTIIVDDESDQATVNTVSPQSKKNGKDRTETNRAIVNLLKELPRAQYIGYTATPFANVFINPDDAEDLFPKDFVVSLPRPDGYMGVADFYDLDETYEEGDLRSNEYAYVRDVRGDDQAPDNLQKAIDSFILSGAIKLYRHAISKGALKFRHHTMLVHHSMARIVHEGQADVVEKIFGETAVLSPCVVNRLSKLFADDFQKVTAARDPHARLPNDFSDLRPFIGDCVARIKEGKAVLIVNGDNKDDTPDFDTSPVWAILVGGAKLSRGYTVEGLTISYYRRVAGAADTLMQMGRWFGFRAGYRDLVRLFIGRDESVGKKHVDLYEHFGAVCRDEEAFRKQLLRYVEDPNIKPQHIPPLVLSHLPELRPTARNKMYNAVLRSMNYGAQWTEKASVSDDDALANESIAADLLRGLKLKLETFWYDTEHKQRIENDAYVGVAGMDEVRKFLTGYKWSDGVAMLSPELEFLSGKHGDPEIKDWLVVLPQLKKRRPYPWSVDAGLDPMDVIERSRVSTKRFNVYSDPKDRMLAECIAMTKTSNAISDSVKKYRSERRGVLMIYRVKVKGHEQEKPPFTIGFGIQYPANKIPNQIVWGAA